MGVSAGIIPRNTPEIPLNSVTSHFNIPIELNTNWNERGCNLFLLHACIKKNVEPFNSLDSAPFFLYTESAGSSEKLDFT